MLRAVTRLCRRDPDLARVVVQHGPPPLWARPPGFATLVRIILEQQVSLASARAAFERLQAGTGRVSAERVSQFSPDRITTFGITRQKAAFIHALAMDVSSGNLNLRSLARSDDPTARSTLIRARGIGSWTADIYLIMALRRPDVWPDGDLALLKSTKTVKGLGSHPSPDVARRIVEAWAPWRSVAARILWHDYLARRRAGERAGRLRKTVSRIVATVCLAVCLGSPTHAQADSAAPGEVRKEALVTARASGTFDVKLTPQATADDAGGASLGRMSIEKQFHGDLEGTSKGEMLTVMTGVEGSAGYVAIERVSGTLHGRRGTFALQHSGVMTRGAPQLVITVVPDSGTDQLVGLAGKMTIDIRDGKHFYELEYTLADSP